jgi:cellobiose-specific phosphotransferase system component IIC
MYFINPALAIAFCILCYIISALALMRSAAYVGLIPTLTNAVPWVTRGAKQDPALRKVRIAGVGLVAFLMGSVLLDLMITAL